jgi:double-stranded uracil-DNA glycosylase
MTVLPDLLANGLTLLIVGSAAGPASARLRAYYAGPGNRFWRTLHCVGLTPTELRPEDYKQLLRHGIGLTDLAKGTSGVDSNLKPEDFDRLRLRAVVKTVSPRVIAFNGKNAAAHFFGVPIKKLNYGRQADAIGRTAIYVCPSTSPANGHWSRSPWEELARAVKER